MAARIMTKFTVLGQPQGKQRARTVKRGSFIHSYTPIKTVEYEHRITGEYKKTCRNFYGFSPLQIRVFAYVEIPKSWSKKVRQDVDLGLKQPTTKPDCDNILKVVFDALNGVAYTDDKQIISAEIYKIYSADPRLEVTICPISNETQNKENIHGG